jgi:hypothetical protein
MLRKALENYIAEAVRDSQKHGLHETKDMAIQDAIDDLNARDIYSALSVLAAYE